MRIECPHCQTSYTTERCGITPDEGTFFTVLCGLCGEAFDGDIVTVDGVTGVPASRLYRYSFGVFGTPAVDAVSAELKILTRRR